MSMEATNLHKVNLCLEWHHGEKKQWIGMPPRALVSDFDEYKHSIHYLIVVAVLRINAAYCLTASMYISKSVQWPAHLRQTKKVLLSFWIFPSKLKFPPLP